jgi:hypothetical protein
VTVINNRPCHGWTLYTFGGVVHPNVFRNGLRRQINHEYDDLESCFAVCRNLKVRKRERFVRSGRSEVEYVGYVMIREVYICRRRKDMMEGQTNNKHHISTLTISPLLCSNITEICRKNLTQMHIRGHHA